MQLHNFTNGELLNSHLAALIKNSLLHAIKLRDQAYLVVSGGKTPIELFKLLAQMALDWDKVTVILADERCVSVDHEDSNERLVKEYLLQHEALKAKFIGLYHETVDLQTIDTEIASIPTFDVVVLGMGEDGHTASLFPCSEELKIGLNENTQAIVRVNPKSAPHQRITLTKKRLFNSRIIFLPLIGQKKQEVLNRALLINDPMTMPISAFLKSQQIDMQVMYAPE